MKIASVLTPTNDLYLSWAAQCGVEGIVIRYPGPGIERIRAEQQRIEAYGMKVAAIEGYLPIERIKLGQDSKQAELEEFKQLLEHMRDLNIQCLCYNFMAGTDWVRTDTKLLERGGARVTGFRLSDAQRAISLNHRQMDASSSISSEQLWHNLGEFLRAILPVAEACGVLMCMHPDDPPLPELAGKSRIMNSVANFERLMSEYASPSNKICFCLGTLATLVSIYQPPYDVSARISATYIFAIRVEPAATLWRPSTTMDPLTCPQSFEP